LKYRVLIVLIFVIGIAGFLYIQLSAPLETLREIRVQMDSTNALRVTVELELKQPKAVYVEYWEEKNKDLVFSTSISPANLKHSIRLVGLLEDRAYMFKVREASTMLAKVSEDGTFYTASVPKAMLRMRWTEKADQPFTGYILSQRPRIKGDHGFVYMVNNNGETAWYNKVLGLPKISCWTERNTVLVLSGNPNQERSAGSHIFEFDVYGNELINLDLTQISTPIEAHHEIRYANDGSLLTLIYDRKNVDLSFQGGKQNEEIKGDAVVRLSKTGEILWKWSVFDVLDPISSTYAFDSVGEWGHANTLSIDQDGNYLISFRDWNEIWKINSKDGSLIWKLGENGDFKLPPEFNFFGQHSIHINPRGEYMMFDNGIKNKRSRVISFTLDENTKTVDVKLDIPLPENLYSEKRGSAYFIASERILVCSPESSSVVIIDLQGNVLARAHTGLPDYYRAVYVPQLY